MFKSLFSKIILVLLVLFGISGVFMIVTTMTSTEMYQQDVNQKLNKDVARNIVNELPLVKDGELNRRTIEQLFHQLMIFNPSIEIYLLGTQGEILSYSAPEDKVKRKRINLEPIQQFLSGAARFPFKGDDPRNAGNQKVFTAEPIYQDGKLQGYLYVILGGEEYDHIIGKLQGSYILNVSTWIIVAGILLSVFTGIIIFAWLTRRLRRLSNAMQLFKQGENVDMLSQFFSDGQSSHDEIGQLQRTFQEMAIQINHQLEQLKTTDKLRRELVANVSHDLRTPMATLQAYTETLLLKDDDLSSQERRDYLKTIMIHCNQLNKLVKELFELAKLDAEETRVVKEAFNPLELIQDVMQKFRLCAEEKGVQLIANFTEDVPYVYADIGLIERVLENLLENALRFTPGGGSIVIKLESGDRQLTIKVSDTGFGIPREELPFIFERFYQANKNRSRVTEGSGLGLSISKRILELHDSDIEVNSQVNNGTTFSFKLQQYYAA